MREERAKIAAETVKISKDGSFNDGQSNITIPQGATTQFWVEADLKRLDCKKTGDTPIIVVENESVVDTVWRSGSTSLGVLVFASAYHPGGGFLKGSMAQEEAIAYCSNLYVQQTTAEGNRFYKDGNSCKTKAYTNNMIYSEVAFFRKSSFDFAPPKVVDVITSAAINKGAMMKNGESISSANDIMKNRMRYILELFAEKGTKELILGAFGCGVFKNDPKDIARIWKELLLEDGYGAPFDKITFSVLEDRNQSYKTFVNVFG